MSVTPTAPPQSNSDRKTLTSLQARRAVRGIKLVRQVESTYSAAKWVRTRDLDDLQAVARFLRLVEGTPK